MSRILITGGCGFLGSWVAAHLEQAGLEETGHDICIFDHKLRTDMLDFVKPGLSARISFIEGDITQTDAVLKAAEGCTAIIHLAGLMTVDCRRDPILSAKVNIIGGLNMLEAARLQHIKKVLYVSTAGVYGAEQGHTPLPETHYGAQKLAIEGAARAYWIDHQISSYGFRPYIIYGPGAGSGISAGPSLACRAAMAREECEIQFSGRVGFVHVEDIARGFTACIKEEWSGAHVANFTGETANMSDFVTELTRQVPEAKITINGEALRIAPELTGPAAAPFLAALPTTSLALGIEKTLNHYRSADHADAFIKQSA